MDESIWPFFRSLNTYDGVRLSLVMLPLKEVGGKIVSILRYRPSVTDENSYLIKRASKGIPV